MTARVLWTLPVPSTALLGTGPALNVRPKREVAIQFAYEGMDDSRRDEALVFEGVEAFRCTYLDARGEWTREAYDRLVDRGTTPWLSEVSSSLRAHGVDALDLVHLMINFDDGPAYEVVCRSFRVDSGSPQQSR